MHRISQSVFSPHCGEPEAKVGLHRKEMWLRTICLDFLFPSKPSVRQVEGTCPHALRVSRYRSSYVRGLTQLKC